MPINDPAAPPQVRYPRIRVTTNGQEIPGVLTAEVTSNNYYQADRYRLGFSLYYDDTHTLNWWGSQGDDKANPLWLKVEFGFEDGEWTTLITGAIDHLQAHPLTGLVELEGRDLTSLMIDAKTDSSYLNKTASEIVTEIASKHGLQTDVTATTTLVNRFYDDDHDHIANGEFSHTVREWDLLTWLADQHQFDVWVEDTTLHFHPRTDPAADPWVLDWRQGEGSPISNAIDLRLERSLALAKDIIVSVKAWRAQDGKGFVATAPAGVSPTKARTGKAIEYVYKLADVPDQDTAQRFAQAKHDEIVKHERVITWTEPGDCRLKARGMVRLQGTNCSWDQVYYIDSITRQISIEGGFTMSCRARNKSAATESATGQTQL